ncbi:MAG: cytochrome c biogenesis CcdA family protein [Candidatus Dormibacteria bacterium]
MPSFLQGAILLTALVGGMVALFAPCCISVMLPAYFAGSFRRRQALVGMTFVFAAGVATVILPIALGATAVSRLIFGYHEPVFLVAGTLMVLMGIVTLTGWRPNLPMLGMRAGTGRGVGSVYGLGVFSGAASACCAPVLAGVVVLSGAAASVLSALLIGAVYVLGMVLPLFVIALLWDRFDWGSSRLFSGRGLRVHLAGRSMTVQPAALIGGLVLVAMGALVIEVAITGPTMSPTGWQAAVGAAIDHYGSRLTALLAPVPGWAVAAALLLLVAILVRSALRRRNRGDHSSTNAATRPAATAVSQENMR